MNSHMDIAVKNSKKIKEYQKLFADAYGNSNITQDEILRTIAAFERTIVSRKSGFNTFMEGDSTQLSNK